VLVGRVEHWIVTGQVDPLTVMDLLLGLFANKFRGKNVTIFQDKSVQVCQDSNVTMFQDR